MLCKRGICRHARCPSVCLSRSCRLYSVKTNEHIIYFFHRRVATPFYFSIPNVMAILQRGPPPLTGASNAGEVGRNRDSEPIPGFIACCEVVNAATDRCYQHGAAGPWQVVTLTAGSKRRSLLMAGDDDEIFMTKSQRYARDNRTAFNCTQ